MGHGGIMQGGNRTTLHLDSLALFQLVQFPQRPLRQPLESSGCHYDD